MAGVTALAISTVAAVSASACTLVAEATDVVMVVVMVVVMEITMAVIIAMVATAHTAMAIHHTAMAMATAMRLMAMHQPHLLHRQHLLRLPVSNPITTDNANRGRLSRVTPWPPPKPGFKPAIHCHAPRGA